MIKKTILSFFTLAMLLCVNVYAGDVGKIVFSKTPVDAKTAESLPPSEFQVGDKIYCWVFLTQPLSKYKIDKNTDSYSRNCVSIYLDGKNIDETACYNSKGFSEEEIKNAISYSFELGYWEEIKKMHPDVTKAIYGLQNGAHTLSVSIELPHHENKTYILATGECKIIKSGNIKSETVTLKSIKPGMNDPALENKALEAIKEFHNKHSLDKYSLNQQRVVITSKNWAIFNHASSGAILGRVVYGVVVLKDKSGKCRYKTYALVQSYTGPGYQDSFVAYADPYLNSTVSSDLINDDCDCD